MECPSLVLKKLILNILTSLNKVKSLIELRGFSCSTNEEDKCFVYSEIGVLSLTIRGDIVIF
jgi:hypothetical protein